MMLEAISPSLGLILFFALTVGLHFSRAFRFSTWVPAVWAPTTLTMTALCVLTLLDSGMVPGFKGHDDWGFTFLCLHLPLFCATAVGLVMCVVWRPRNEGRNKRWGIPSALAAAAILYLFYWNHQVVVDVVFTDESGQLLQNVPISKNDFPPSKMSDSGVVHFSSALRPFSARAHLYPWALNAPKLRDWEIIIDQQASPARLRVSHRWTGGRFTEYLPLKHSTRIQIPVPLESSLESPFIHEKIRTALVENKRITPDDYDEIFHSVEAIEFMPQLISQNQQIPERWPATWKALTNIASILNDLNDQCRSLEQDIKNRSKYSSITHPKGLEPLCTWANVPYDKSSDSLALIAQVRERIKHHADILIKVAMRKGDNAEDVDTSILAELHSLARPTLPRLIQLLHETPPTDMKIAHSWGRLFYRIGATKREVATLRESGNPMLEEAARDARTDPEER